MPAPPRPSASVILVRPGAEAAWEVFMVRRPAESRFAPDVYVFPGGTVRADDYPPADAPPLGLTAEAAHARLEGAAGAGGPTAPDSLALWLAALRELFEEAGVLLARDAGGGLVTFDDPARAARLAADRLALQRGATTLWAICAREGLSPALEHLRYWAHFITPEGAPRRFDTRFFLAPLPPGQEALHCAVETTDGRWIAPAAALALHERGQFPLVFATRAHLERLARFATLDALFAHAATKRVVTVRPWADFSVSPPRVEIPAEVRECW
ncbi:MAG: hypothetical protein IRZ14_07255 [Chloroflexi bacterium]|nr:hypothetical protein [Chloroflexota bacterium]